MIVIVIDGILLTTTHKPPSDFAWNNFRHLHVYTESMKKRVEQRFKQDMMDVCNSKSNPKKWCCKRTAEIYAWTVRKWPANKATDSGP
jgi:hypothetical protein